MTCSYLVWREVYFPGDVWSRMMGSRSMAYRAGLPYTTWEPRGGWSSKQCTGKPVPYSTIGEDHY